jgi:hypothetical protein
MFGAQLQIVMFGGQLQSHVWWLPDIHSMIVLLGFQFTVLSVISSHSRVISFDLLSLQA